MSSIYTALGRNDIDNNGLIEIANVLNFSLISSIELYSNKFNLPAINALANMLKTNVTLVKLSNCIIRHQQHKYGD